MELHRQITDQIRKEIDRVMKESLENFQIYKSFFQERAAQEELYAEEKVINTVGGFENNDISRFVYMNSSSMLNFLAKKESEERAKIRDLVVLLK